MKLVDLSSSEEMRRLRDLRYREKTKNFDLQCMNNLLYKSNELREDRIR